MSVGKEIYIGLKYVANGISKVVKAVAHDVEEAMAAIGSFFVQLGKDLLKAIEALSLLLHLGEVVKTAKIISTQINASFTSIQTVLTNGKAAFDTFFTNAEATIENAFCGLFSSLGLPQGAGCSPQSGVGGSSTPLSGFGGMGATQTSVYNTGQTTGSRSVQCGWSGQTMRANMGNATDTSTTLAAVNANDPLGDLLNPFLASLENNAGLKQAYSDVQQSFSATFKSQSPKEFLEMAVEDILEIMQALIITGVAVTQALLDALLSDIIKLVSVMQTLGNVNIPILSALWRKLTGNELSYLDLISFVLAFPATLLYKAVTGNYPSSASTVTTQQVGATPTVAEDVMAIVSALGLLLNGIGTAAIDGAFAAYYSYEPEAVGRIDPLWKVAGVLGLIGIAGDQVVVGVDSENTYALLNATIACCNPNLLIWGKSNPMQASVMGVILNGLGVVFAALAYAEKQQPSSLTLSRQVVASFAPLVNPVKFVSVDYLIGFLAPMADVGCRFAAAGIQLFQAIEAIKGRLGEEQEYVIYMPIVSTP